MIQKYICPWLSWLSFILILTLCIVYIVTHWHNEPFYNPELPQVNSRKSSCITVPILKDYTNSANELKNALNTVIKVYDTYLETQMASAKETDITEGPPPPQTDNTQYEFNIDKNKKTATTLEGFKTVPNTGTNRCLNPIELEYVRKQYKEQPLALFKIYNKLRDKVNEGIKSIQYTRKLNNEIIIQEEERQNQILEIEKGSKVKGNTLNDYYYK